MTPPTPALPAIDTIDASASSRHIHGTGTPEAEWAAWPALAMRPALDLADATLEGRRLVVVAPHPDDELLMCGGWLAMQARAAAANGPPALIVGVTDGEKSHPGSAVWPEPRLAATRCDERVAGLQRLGVRHALLRLGVPDGGVAPHEAALAERLMQVLDTRDLVITTWRLDGHPDHEATGRACARACAATGSVLFEAPVWAWHWARPADARLPWDRLHRLPLTHDAWARKRQAIATHRTQLRPDGERAAVLFPEAVRRASRDAEYFLKTTP